MKTFNIGDRVKIIKTPYLFDTEQTHVLGKKGVVVKVNPRFPQITCVRIKGERVKAYGCLMEDNRKVSYTRMGEFDNNVFAIKAHKLTKVTARAMVFLKKRR